MAAIAEIGEALRWLGFGVAGLSLAAAAAGIIVRLVMLVTGREVPRNLSFLGFRSYLVATLGVQVAIVGMVLAGRMPWLFLLSLLVFGMPAVVALRAPLDFPGLPPPTAKR